MKKFWIAAAIAGTLISATAIAQKKIVVPQIVKDSFAKKFPDATKVVWETEKGNYEANWGGKSGEDNSVLYTPSGHFIEIAKAITVQQLPENAAAYIKAHYKKSAVNEAAMVTDSKGKITYEAEIAHKELVFDEHGNYLKKEKE